MKAALPAAGWLKALAMSAGFHAAAGTVVLALVAGAGGAGEGPPERVMMVALVEAAPPGSDGGGAQGAPSASVAPPPPASAATLVEEASPGPDGGGAQGPPTATQARLDPQDAHPVPGDPALSAPASAPGTGGEGAPAGPVRAGCADAPAGSVRPVGDGALIPASALELPRPRYPEAARRRGQEGTVLLAVTVGEGGSAGEVEVLRSSGSPLLDRAACDAARQARFAPARAGERPVVSTRRVAFTFRLEEGEE